MTKQSLRFSLLALLLFFQLPVCMLASVSPAHKSVRGGQVKALSHEESIMAEKQEELQVFHTSPSEMLPAQHILPAESHSLTPAVTLTKADKLRPHPRRYMDQRSTALLTLGLGGALVLFGGGVNLLAAGTTSSSLAMLAGIGTICLVLGFLFLLVGLLMLLASYS